MPAGAEPMNVDITGLALEPAGMCFACGHEAVELVRTLEDPGHDGAPLELLTCRACDPDAFHEPGADIITGSPIDAFFTLEDERRPSEDVDQGDQLGLLEIAPTSTFTSDYGTAPAPLSTSTLF
jgi:hypothetical protein